MAYSEFEDEYDAWMRGEEHHIGGTILKDPIGKLEPRLPVAVGPKATVAECIALLCQHGIGCVLVTDDGKANGRPVGIFTERDVVKKVARLGLDAASTEVSKVMTPNPETLPADERVVVALNRMMVGGYRHIPVVDGAGRAVGILSVRNFVRFIVSLFPEAVLNQPPSRRLKHPNRMDGG
ncbi:MAG: CBS domain-containing protein [Acidobacteriota bacterium]